MRHSIPFALLLIASLFVTTTALAQQASEPNLRWGHPTQQEMEMTSYTPDPSADAVVLCKTTDAHYVITKDVLQVLYEVKGRIKILKPEGIKHGAIDIYYTVNDGVEGNREDVTSVKGATYNLVNGNEERSELTSDMINTHNAKDRKQRVMTLLLPDVRVGSVIEYEYTITSDIYREIKDWNAQCELPVAYTRYDVSIPEWFGFYVQTIGNEYNTSHITQRRTAQRPTYVIETAGAEYECLGVNFEFEGRKLTALKNEPLIFSPQVYAQRVIIDINTELLPRHTKHQYSMTWNEIDQYLLKHNNFGKLLGNNPLKKEMKKAGIMHMKSNDNKIMATVQLLRQHVSWNGKYDLYGNNPSQVVKNGTGSNADLNLLLIAMLSDAGINAYPAVLCERGHDIIDENRPTMKNLTSMVALIDRGDSDFYAFDGSVENASLDILPAHFLVSKARIIKKDNNSPWINLESRGVEVASHKITGAIDGNGKLTGICETTYDGKAAEWVRMITKIEGEKMHNPKLQSPMIAVSGYKLQGLDDITGPVTETVNFSTQLSVNNGVIELPQLIVPFIDEKLFESDTRYNPIEFRTKKSETIDFLLAIPEGWEVADVPAPISLNTSDKTINMSITPSTAGNTVKVAAHLSIDRLVFNKRDYKGIKNLVDRIIQQSKVPFIIKKKN